MGCVAQVVCVCRYGSVGDPTDPTVGHCWCLHVFLCTRCSCMLVGDRTMLWTTVSALPPGHTCKTLADA